MFFWSLLSKCNQTSSLTELIFLPWRSCFLERISSSELDQSFRSLLWLTAMRGESCDAGSFNPIRGQWIHHLWDNNFLASLEADNHINVPALSSAPCVDSFSSCVCCPLKRSSGFLLLRCQIRSEFKHIKSIREGFHAAVPRASGCQLRWNCSWQTQSRKSSKSKEIGHKAGNVLSHVLTRHRQGRTHPAQDTEGFFYEPC